MIGVVGRHIHGTGPDNNGGTLIPMYGSLRRIIQMVQGQGRIKVKTAAAQGNACGHSRRHGSQICRGMVLERADAKVSAAFGFGRKRISDIRNRKGTAGAESVFAAQAQGQVDATRNVRIADHCQILDIRLAAPGFPVIINRIVLQQCSDRSVAFIVGSGSRPVEAHAFRT